MSRINSNVSSLISQRILSQNNQNLTKSLERLSTGFKINRGSDNPAGLIASENLRAQKVALDSAIGNAERADQIANIMEGGLQEISSLLQEVQGLIGQNGSETGLSKEEKEANQLQVDQIIQTIDRIANTTTFNGAKLLNGTQDFRVKTVDANVTDYQVNGAKFTKNASVDVSVVVTQSAQHAGLFLNLSGAVVNTGGGDATERLTFELAGTKGTREFSFSSGTTIASVAAAINQFKEQLGVSAVTSGNLVEIKSTSFGSSEFVSVDLSNIAAGQVGSVDEQTATNEALAGGTSTAFTAMTAAIRDTGQDIGAVINGITAGGKGLTASIASDALDLSLTLDTAAGGAQTLGTVAAFSIIGGGASFNLGPEVNISNQVRIGVGNIASRNLGSVTNGFLDDLGTGQSVNIVSGNLDTAQKIIDDAIDDVTKLRGRIGSFQSNVVQSTLRLLNVSLENTTAAESIIRDTDFAKATAELTRNQILVSAATSGLQIANAQPQSILSLL